MKRRLGFIVGSLIVIWATLVAADAAPTVYVDVGVAKGMDLGVAAARHSERLTAFRALGHVAPPMRYVAQAKAKWQGLGIA